jgi:CheY-like chemotaxis protein
LVVDDDPHVADLVRQLLEDEPYVITTAMDGQEALAAVSRQRPDIVLLDLLMPHLDGFSVLAHLQQEPDYRDLPVLVLTAKTLTVEEQGRLQERVRTVIQKGGLERAALIQELQAALQTYGHRRNG